MDDEEKFIFQKAKVDWMSKRDKNNKYFHKVLKSINQYNKIVSICNEEGINLEGELKEEQFVKHFQKFLGTSNNNAEWNTEGLFGTRLTEREANDMDLNITDSEIMNAMFDIGEHRAPGPDG